MSEEMNTMTSEAEQTAKVEKKVRADFKKKLGF